MIKPSFHNHTTFSDGADTPEEFLRAALSSGLKKIGFSDHSPLPFFQDWVMTGNTETAYKKEITRLKNAYRGRINVFLGIERDLLSPISDGYDYVIGAAHFLERDGVFYGVDEGEDRFRELLQNCFDGDADELAKVYFESQKTLPEKTACSVIAHFDLISKYNENDRIFDSSSKKYLAYAGEALQTLVGKKMIIEVNTGAMARSLRTAPYPSENILKILKDLNARLLLSSDCHDVKKLCFGFDEAARVLKKTGFRDNDLVNGIFPEILSDL